MPYIKSEDKERLKPILDVVYMAGLKNVGELNYLITSIIQMTEKELGTSYTTYNALIGCLECIKLELYRRRVSHYEDKKSQENGDVY